MATNELHEGGKESGMAAHIVGREAECYPPGVMADQPSSVDDMFFEADRMISVADPDEKPYQSKYAARELLQAWRCKQVQGDGNGVVSKVAIARAAFRLGKIGLDTEEPHVAEEELSAALDVLVPGLVAKINGETQETALDERVKPDAVEAIRPPDLGLLQPALQTVEADGGAKVAEDTLECLNLLGILWSQREQSKRALLYLLAAKELYKQFDPLCPVQVHTSLDRPCSALGDEAEGTFRRRLDSHYTHTLFYLAQVYGNLRCGSLAAVYCHQTLQRQLEADVKLDTLSWVKNCLDFVNYLLNAKQDFAAAARCLSACSKLLSERVPESVDHEQVSTARGDVARRWAAVYLAILRDASEAKDAPNAAADAERPPPSPPAHSDADPPSITPGSSTLQWDNDDEEFQVEFKSLNLRDVDVPKAQDVQTYEQARDLFLKGVKHLEEARQVFVMDGFVTNHVEILRDISRFYRYLSSFETDEKRRMAMYSRRAATLQPVLSEISPKAYDGLHKQLSFELGEIYMEMLDTKLVRIEDKVDKNPDYQPKRSEVEKCDEYCRQAISAFEHFCSMYQREDSKDSSNKVWSFEKDELRLILRAKFHVARLYGRLHLFGTRSQKVAAMKKSLEAYEGLRAFATRELKNFFGGDMSIFEQELRMVNDMIELLPQKIARMHYMRQDLSA